MGKVIDAMGNRLLYVGNRLALSEESVVSLCKQHSCDGLFAFNRKKNIMRYYDCDGFQNFCGNAARVLPFVLDVKKISFSEELTDGTLVPVFSWKEDDLYAIILNIQSFEELGNGLFWAYVGNYQMVFLCDSVDFRYAKETAKRWREVFEKESSQRPPNCSFVLAESPTKARVRVIEDFGGETLSCCSSASVVTKVMNVVFPESKEFTLEYKGGCFQTRLCDPNSYMVILKGTVKIEG